MVARAERHKPRTPLRVLIVEDSEDDALLLLRELKRGGYEPDYERVDTPEAMERALADSASWDVIFSDYRMPRFSAPEALKTLQDSDLEAPFIVVSGKVGEDVAVEAMKAGAYDYVMKDNLTRLCTTLERGLEEAGERRERRRAERELGRRDATLQAVGFAAERFLSRTSGWEESIEDVLERLGVATGVSRVYIFENHVGEDGEVWGTQRYEWVAPGVSAQMDNPLMEDIPYRAAGYGRWVESWGRGEVVYGHTREFPEQEQPELVAQDILSIAVVPIFVEGRWWGQIGFDECSAEREWSATEMDALKAAAGTLGAAIQRRLTEEELRGSEERYRAVIEQATDGIYLLDSDTRRLLETNPSFQKMLGYAASELRGMEVYDFVAHTRQNIDYTISRTLAQKRRLVGERKYRRKDGSLVDVEVGVSVISHGGKEVICTIVRDVTERKRSEEALKESEARHRAVVDTAFDAVVTMSSDGRIQSFNQAAERIFGYAAKEVVGQRLELLMPERFRSSHRAGLRRYLETGEAHAMGQRRLELAGLRKNGVDFPLELSISEIREGEDVLFVGIIRDITERKRSEEALRQSERLYRTVIEQATENIYLVDVETRRILESNPAFQEMLGYTDEELRRRTLYDIVAANRESIDGNVQLMLEHKRYFVGERKYRRKDGSQIDVEASASVILLDGKETLCIVAHDVTERARVQELLQQRVTTLSRISADLTLDLPVESTLNILAESVVNASTAVACAVVLVNEKADKLHLFGSYGLPEGYTAGLRAAYRTGVRSPALRALHTRQPMLFHDIRRFLLADPLYSPIHRFVREVPWDITYNLPLIYRGRALGVIFFCFLPEQEPGEDEEAFLKAVADQTAVAVENAHLFAEARDKAALEERQRLARELHDSVSQALYGIALGTKTARKLLMKDPNQVAEPLDYVLSLSEAGLAEMRALIFELRPESLETEGLVAALEKQAAALEARHGVEVEAILCNEPMVSLETKEAIYRIAQEAIHNTVKHARATNVRIRMECDPEWIILSISDDGIGFDVQGDFPGHLGLRSMRERASRLGGTLEVESVPGSKTRIHARIPT